MRTCEDTMCHKVAAWREKQPNIPLQHNFAWCTEHRDETMKTKQLELSDFVEIPYIAPQLYVPLQKAA